MKKKRLRMTVETRKTSRMIKLQKITAAVLTAAVLFQSAAIAAEVNPGSGPELPPKYNVSEIILIYNENANAESIKKKISRAIRGKLTSLGTEPEGDSFRERIDVGSTDNMEAALKALDGMDGVECTAPSYKIYSQSSNGEPEFEEYVEWDFDDPEPRLCTSGKSRTASSSSTVKSRVIFWARRKSP